MDLRTKTFCIIGFTFLGGILLIILFSFTLLNVSYAQFEQDDAIKNVMKGIKILDYEKQQLISLTADWSRWDETYFFVQDKNDDYVIRNLNYESVKNIGIDYLIFLRKDNSVKYSAGKNLSAGCIDPLPDNMVMQVLSIPGFFSFSSILDAHSGFINLPEGPSLIVSQPVITSTYEGPSTGVLVLGLYLDDDRVQKLSDRSDLSLSITNGSVYEIPSSAFRYSDKQNGSVISIFPQSDENIIGLTSLPTLDSNGSVSISITMPRDITKQGRNTIVTYLIILMVLGLVIILVSLITVDRLVLQRLHTLIEKIKKRTSEREETLDSLLEGDDEFTDLAREIHPVFLELNKSRRQLEEHVRLLTESERKYRELVDLLPEFVFECDLKGNITFLNQMGLAVSGYTGNEFESGLHILTIIDSEDHQRFLSTLQLIRDGKMIIGKEYSGQKKNGETFPLVVYAAPIREGNDITGFRGFAIDISERKKFEASLTKLANIVENTNTGIITGTGDVIDYVNSSYSVMHGMESGEYIGKSPFIDVVGYPEKDFTSFLECAIQTGHTTFEIDHNRKDGTRFPVMHNLTILSGTIAKNATWSLNVQDITEQRLAWKMVVESEALRESARQLRDVISRLPDATFVIDKDGWVIFWNHAMELLTEISDVEIIGRGKYEYAIPFYGEKRPMLLNAVLDKEGTLIDLFPDVSRSGDSIFIEESFPKMGKGGKFFSSMAGPLYDSKGSIIGAIQSMRDITPRIMAERALIRTNEKLNLLSSITRHDIRNRVTVILGLLPLLSGTCNDPDTTKIIKILEEAARLIQDQVEFSRVYQDLGVRSPEWKDVSALVRTVSDVGIPERISIVNNLSGLMVYADPLLERVFYNLIDNALRHGGEFLTTIRFSWNQEDEAVCIICEDNGPGVPDDLKETIFERGYGSNTGLGLFLVREILSITGITIIEAGKAGVGARFEIRVTSGGYTYTMQSEKK